MAGGLVAGKTHIKVVKPTGTPYRMSYTKWKDVRHKKFTWSQFWWWFWLGLQHIRTWWSREFASKMLEKSHRFPLNLGARSIGIHTRELNQYAFDFEIIGIIKIHESLPTYQIDCFDFLPVTDREIFPQFTFCRILE